MYRIGIPFAQLDLFGHAIDMALVVPADGAGEDDPVAFPVSDAMVFYLLFLT
jgi:hypothetical protein